ncbi:MAG: Type 1 glutamine amidotransferase-like domain-containing protein [Ignavibacteriales bacterium]|nr:Type 1 glutamine amidotransferase-like domain-containing protein [Ignavibacteriales bacterium]
MKKNLFYIYFLLVTISVYPQGSVLLVGGGTENYGDWSDQPYKWFVEHAPNQKILVLSYADTTTWFSGYFPSLSQCKVSNKFISSTAQANDSSIYRLILQHDGIFLRGGDQAQYVSKWKNTLTQKAIKEVFQRGGVIGGTSAGEMVLSNVSYTSGSTDNGAILRNPNATINLEEDFLPFVQNAIAESHTNERGRLGRLPVFLARYKDSKGKEITGIAVDANTAVAIDQNGIGQVMGGSAVALLRWNPDTKFTIEPGRSFSIQNMNFDQLLPGWKFNFKTGEIEKLSTAAAFNPKQISSPKGTIILDGSGSISDWSAATGSLKKFKSVLKNSTDIVGIFSSPLSVATAGAISSALNSFGSNTKILLVNESRKNDSQFTSDANLCGAFIFAGNSLDSLAGFFNSSTSIGQMLNAKIQDEKPLLFLSEDVMLAGEKVIGGIYGSQYSAYYGTITQLIGLDLIKGIQFVPRFYQNLNNSIGYDYSENRIDGLFWSMAKSKLPYGMIIDAGTYMIFSDGKFYVEGVSPTSTSVIMIDARKVQWIDYPVFHRPGRPNAVNNAALIGASLNIIRPGDSNPLTSLRQERNLAPNSFCLEQNYPNPFNPTTTLRYSISEPGIVTLKIYDILGREVASLLNDHIDAGIYETHWDASRNASGIYFAQLNYSSKGTISSKTNKLVLNK